MTEPNDDERPTCCGSIVRQPDAGRELAAVTVVLAASVRWPAEPTPASRAAAGPTCRCGCAAAAARPGRLAQLGLDLAGYPASVSPSRRPSAYSRSAANYRR